MAKSLLAHLYSRIRGSQEDVATISLQYLLSQSAVLNRVFTKAVASSLQVELDETLQYQCQATGEHKEKPDMAGVCKDGSEVVLCEMKFYAGLTENQPRTYLDRLKEEGGKGLVFVCPQSRVISLWAKLRELCAERCVTVGDFCISVDGVSMSILTWSAILKQLQNAAVASAPEHLSDIEQIAGYCEQMDSDAFIPFTADDLSAEVVKRAERYYAVLDHTVQLLSADEHVDTSLKGLKATAYRGGYQRSIYIDGFGVTIVYDRDLWKSDCAEETPFWVSVRSEDWEQTGKFTTRLTQVPEHKKDDKLWNMVFFSLQAPIDSTLSEVCENLKQQILEYVDIFR